MPKSRNPQPESKILGYEPSPVAGTFLPRPWWKHTIVAIYLAIFAGLFTIPYWLTVDWVPYLVFLGILLFCGFSLIIIPIKSVRRRPISRRSIWFPIIISGLLAGALVYAGGFALAEFERAEDSWLKPIIITASATWILWSTILIPIAFSRGPKSIGMRLHHLVLAGSFLELLVAVPTHIVVRRRNECCAGIETGLAICFGLLVALIALGPSMLFLYFRRAKQTTNR